ncbi:hypothetical protein [Cryptosporangium japonicum]|uniref:RiboL-PSP-HEPN domain-containing protein n=1 Tax=Cryptosporangium japonicum TaxID=80872 RepID=A0ABP3EL72_9ACTN
MLDKGNANRRNIDSDFSRLGFDVGAAVVAANPNKGVRWIGDLEILNQARNGIAHADESKLLKLRSDGHPVNLTTVRRLRRSLDGLAAAMDEIVSDSLALLLQSKRPW